MSSIQKIIIGLSLLTCISSEAKKLSHPDVTRLKECLIQILNIENDFFEEHKRFTSDLVDFNLSDTPVCKDVKIDLTQVKDKEFIIEGQLKKHIWAVDHRRSLKQLK